MDGLMEGGGGLINKQIIICHNKLQIISTQRYFSQKIIILLRTHPVTTSASDNAWRQQQCMDHSY